MGYIDAEADLEEDDDEGAQGVNAFGALRGSWEVTAAL